MVDWLWRVAQWLEANVISMPLYIAAPAMVMPPAVSTCGATEEDALRRAGLAPGEEFALLCRRIARPVREEGYARAGIPITGG